MKKNEKRQAIGIGAYKDGKTPNRPHVDVSNLDELLSEAGFDDKPIRLVRSLKTGETALFHTVKVDIKDDNNGIPTAYLFGKLVFADGQLSDDLALITTFQWGYLIRALEDVQALKEDAEYTKTDIIKAAATNEFLVMKNIKGYVQPATINPVTNNPQIDED